MASSFIKLTTINNLAPNQSVIHHWNNATPLDAVWHIQAIPLESSFTSIDPPEQHMEAEVTRIWRRVNRTPKSSDVQPWVYEHEIWYEVKNVGSRKVDVGVYASIVS
jgi:hypothetical protein